MEESRYNFYFDYNDEQIVGYNSHTNSLSLIEIDKFEAFKAKMKGEDVQVDEKFLADMKHCGFIVNSKEEEQKLLKYNMHNGKFNTNSLSMTIAPSLACNLKCVYCYEKNSQHKDRLTTELKGQLVDFVQKHLAIVNNLSITWYGGEPLMEMETIRELSTRFAEDCKEHKVAYDQWIITNGLLLTEDVAKELKELGVTNAQVTIDGTREIHDKRRPKIDNGSSYDIILNNIAESADYIDIVLRINVDKNNLDDYVLVLDDIERLGLKEKISIYIGHVQASNDCYNKHTCLSNPEYSQAKLYFTSILLERGYKYRMSGDYPSSRSNHCLADQRLGLVLGPDGYFYKCWSDIGIEEYRTGSLTEGVQVDTKRLFDYMLYDPFEDAECAECQYLPVCMGGCPKKRLDGYIERCTYFKYSFDKYIENAVNYVLAQRKEKVEAEACV